MESGYKTPLSGHELSLICINVIDGLGIERDSSPISIGSILELGSYFSNCLMKYYKTKRT